MDTNTTEPRHAADDGAAEDRNPVLAPVAPQYDPSDAEGVDRETFPALRDFRRMLPAQRLREQANLGAIMDGVPASFRTAVQGGEVDVSTLTGADLDALASTFERVQDVVLTNAEDPEAMTEWLLAQKDSIQAVMYGFMRYQAALGN